MGRFVLCFIGAISLALVPQIALTNSLSKDFFCRAEGRFLTDLEFLENAFNYEVTKEGLQEPFRSLGVQGIREIDPGCCQVLRADNPFNENRTWLDRLLSGPSVWVIIGWDLDPKHGGNNNTNYDMTTCGRIIKRRGDFRPRDYGN